LVDAMQQPAGQLELAVEQCTLRQVLVGAAAPPDHVGLQGELGGCPTRGHEPVQVARGVADRQRRPPDDRADRVAVDEDRVGGEGAVDHGGAEPPERLVVGRLLPPAQDRRGQVPGVGGAPDELDDPVAGLVGGLAGEPGVAHEPARQGVYRRDRGADRRGEGVMLGELVGGAHPAREELGHDGARAVDGRLAHELRHAERQAGADPGRHRADGDEVGGLLRLGVLGPRRADDEVPAIGRTELDGVEAPVAAARVRTGRAHLEAGHRRRGQRG